MLWKALPGRAVRMESSAVRQPGVALGNHLTSLSVICKVGAVMLALQSSPTQKVLVSVGYRHTINVTFWNHWDPSVAGTS